MKMYSKEDLSDRVDKLEIISWEISKNERNNKLET